MKAVGTLFGGPPVVRSFTVSANVPAAGGAIGDIVIYDQSVGKIDVADYNDSTWLAGANNDQLDDDLLTGGIAYTTTAAAQLTATDGDYLCGILMAPCVASQTAKVPVAMFGKYNVFEANLTSWVDGDTVPTALTSLITHRGRHMYIAAVDPSINYTVTKRDATTYTQVTPNGIWVLSDTGATGTTWNLAKVIEIGYGDPVADADLSDGAIGDKNVRVRFTITNDGNCFLS
jgi:hypothetical protein